MTDAFYCALIFNSHSAGRPVLPQVVERTLREPGPAVLETANEPFGGGVRVRAG